MANNKSNYLEGKIIEHVLRNVSYTSPSTVYLALYTSNPAEDNSGSEYSGGSYSRQSISFSAQSNGTVTNSGTVAFTNLGSGTITHIGILDNSSGGNLLYYGPLTTSLTITTGSSINFATASISVSEL